MTAEPETPGLVSADATPTAAPPEVVGENLPGSISGEVFVKTMRGATGLAGARLDLFGEEFIRRHGYLAEQALATRGELQREAEELVEELRGLGAALMLAREYDAAGQRARDAAEGLAAVSRSLAEFRGHLSFFDEKRPMRLPLRDPFSGENKILNAWEGAAGDRPYLQSVVKQLEELEVEWKDKEALARREVELLEASDSFGGLVKWLSGEKTVEYYHRRFMEILGLQRALLLSEKQLREAQRTDAPIATVILDRDGKFRFEGLEAGRYALVIHVEIAEDSSEGTRESSAGWFQVVEVEAGEEVAGVRLAQSNALLLRQQRDLQILQRQYPENRLRTFLQEFLVPDQIEKRVQLLLERDPELWEETLEAEGEERPLITLNPVEKDYLRFLRALLLAR